MPTPPIYRLTNSTDTPVLMLVLTSKTLPLTTVSWQTVTAGLPEWIGTSGPCLFAPFRG